MKEIGDMGSVFKGRFMSSHGTWSLVRCGREGIKAEIFKGFITVIPSIFPATVMVNKGVEVKVIAAVWDTGIVEYMLWMRA